MDLTISHHIYLNREQRYEIHEGKEFDVIGVSLPVWTENGEIINKHTKEIFCKYYLSNPKKELAITILKDGFEITLPYRPGKQNKSLSDEEWRRMNFHNPELLDEWYKKQIYEVSSKNLLDLKDGGSAHLYYREHNKIKKNDTILNIMHFVSINDISKLEKSLFIPSLEHNL